MKFRKSLFSLVVGVALGLVPFMAPSAASADDLKIGVIMTMSGTFASHGKQLQRGLDLYLAEHGDTVAGRRLRLLIKDDTGMAPAVAKRLAQELLIRDKVDILAGFNLTPNAFAVAPLATQANVPMLVLNAATSSITEKSPNIVRVSMTLPQNTEPMAVWAYENGIRKVYTLVADYGPGHDAEQQFHRSFTALGGEVAGSVRTPVATTDYAPFLQRVKDTEPEALFVFVPNGEQGVALARGIRERGLHEAGIRVLATGDVTDEDVLDAMGDATLGMITSYHYSELHDSDKNREFTRAYRKAYPGERPNFMAMAAYDGMHLIFQVLEQTGGDASAAAFVQAASGMQWESPRGPVQIDPATRDVVQNVYIRRVERVDGLLQNVEFDVIKAVKDPGKSN